MAVTSREAGSGEGFSGVILAIDYGRKRLGLALSDQTALIPRPFAVWNRTNRRRDLARLRDFVRQQRVRRVIVGLPLHSDGSASEMSEEAQAFAARVQKALALPVEMMDERLTSWEAQEIRTSGKSKRRGAAHGSGSAKPEGRVDDLAAAVILRDYLEHPWASRKITLAPRKPERPISAPVARPTLPVAPRAVSGRQTRD